MKIDKMRIQLVVCILLLFSGIVLADILSENKWEKIPGEFLPALNYALFGHRCFRDCEIFNIFHFICYEKRIDC
jgi:hypothetical protein